MKNLFRFRDMDVTEREAMLERLDRMTELPLLLLAFIMVPTLLVITVSALAFITIPDLLDTLREDVSSVAGASVFGALAILIWAIFAADFLLKLFIAPDRRRYLSSNWLEALTVIIPFFRPLRILRKALVRLRGMEVSARNATLERLDRITELPLLLLAFIMVPVLLGPLLWEDSFSSAEKAVFQTLDWLIWTVFAVDFLIKLSISPDRRQYLRRHWLEALTVLVPFLRPLRILRLVLFSARAIRGARRLVNVDFLIVYALGIVVIAATVVTGVERGNDIDSFPDALWWAVVTTTTVGYGDMTPATGWGRIMAIMLMLVGIGLFGGLTANFASTLFRTEENAEASSEQILNEMKELREEVRTLRQNVSASAQPEPERGFSLSSVTNIIREQTSNVSSAFRRGGESDAREESGDDNMPDAQIFRQAWGKFATGVSVITTAQSDDEIHGMTANGITSVSLDPLLALVCAGHNTTSYPLIKESGRFAINILSEDQQAIAEYYARPTDQKTGDVPMSFSRTAQGAATLDGSLAYMDCRVVSEYVAGDHTIFIGEVEELDVASGRPLLYFEGRFNRLPSEE